MAQRRFTLILLAWLTCLLPPLPAHAALFGNSHGNQFIPAEQAFRFHFRQQGSRLTLSWDIHPGYYFVPPADSAGAGQCDPGAFTLPAPVAATMTNFMAMWLSTAMS